MVTKHDGPKDNPKAAVLKLLTAGLITKSEAANLAKVSKQLVTYWTAGIDVKGARAAFVARLWKRKGEQT